jgi:cytochrome c oxidase subunit 2
MTFFQEPATPVMEGIIDLHNTIMFYLVFILFAVLFMFAEIIYSFYIKESFPRDINEFEDRFDIYLARNTRHATLLELIWTISPAVILMLIASPSFNLLYAEDEMLTPGVTVKAIGHQWYWSYEYSSIIEHHVEGSKFAVTTTIPGQVRLLEVDNKFAVTTTIPGKNFDSYMIPTTELVKGQVRLLEVDNMMVLPVNVNIQILITATDVIHSWAVPSLGVKVDALPGRLNQTSVFIKREGLFFGQCSELCGVNHGFMPIAVKGVTFDKFIGWMKQDNTSEVIVEKTPING